jgi:hypothetical protein
VSGKLLRLLPPICAVHQTQIFSVDVFHILAYFLAAFERPFEKKSFFLLFFD